jgi:calcineurin-like phosphoesterase family protein
MIRYIENISLKLLMSVVPLLLLLTMVAYTPPFLHKVLAATDTHIAAAGDWGCSSNTEKTVNNVKSKNPQLLLALGDYSYEKTSTCWLDLIKPVDSITKINLGNHEDHGLVDSYLSHFGLSNPFYSYNINNVHVLTMATEEKFDTNSEQYNFVVNDLRNAANNPDIKWIIVTMHSPFYSSPNTFKEFDCGGDEACQLYHPLFDKYGVDLVLQGHVHNYERSFPLKFNQATPSNPIVTSTMKTDYENPDGEIFAIVGTGGVNLHGLSDSAPFIASQQDSNFGILDIHLSDNKLDAKFVTNDGVIDDHFSISKTAKKKIIERISDNIVTDTNVKQVSDKGDTKAKPVIVKDENGKPTISYITTDTNAIPSDKQDTKAKPLSEDKPTITYKQSEVNTATDTNAKLSDKQDTKAKPLSEDKPNDNAATDTNAKPLSDKVDTKAKALSEDKPTITYKQSDDNTATDTNAKPLSDKVDTKAKALSEDKPNDNTATDTNAKPQSDKVDTKAKPSISKQLSNDGLTDDKPKSTHNEDKIDLSNNDKSTNVNSHLGGLLGPTDTRDPVDDEETADNHGDMRIKSNEKDPFSSVN